MILKSSDKTGEVEGRRGKWVQIKKEKAGRDVDRSYLIESDGSGQIFQVARKGCLNALLVFISALA